MYIYFIYIYYLILEFLSLPQNFTKSMIGLALMQTAFYVGDRFLGQENRRPKN